MNDRLSNDSQLSKNLDQAKTGDLRIEISPKTEVNHVFVYGTLRLGERAYQKLENRTEYVGNYRVPGRIFNLGSFPGIRLDSPGVFTFCGDLFKIKDEDVLQALDGYEGYREDDHAGSLYLRKVIDVHGTPAYVYEFNRDIAASPIRSGDWKNR
jgi:gamma-glutamylcyclotransferase (GGCT)/AIG2-like uncharacterized protein YtfP